MMITQTVPPPGKTIHPFQREHRNLMKRYRDEPPSQHTLEGYVVAKLLVAALGGSMAAHSAEGERGTTRLTGARLWPNAGRWQQPLCGHHGHFGSRRTGGIRQRPGRCCLFRFGVEPLHLARAIGPLRAAHDEVAARHVLKMIDEQRVDHRATNRPHRHRLGSSFLGTTMENLDATCVIGRTMAGAPMLCQAWVARCFAASDTALAIAVRAAK